MSANVTPIFSGKPRLSWGTTAITAANTNKDGTGTTLSVFTADATNGSWVQSVTFRAAGTNVATVGRVFVNNGSSSATPANNVLRGEITLSATTLSEVAALSTYDLPLNFGLPAGYVLMVALGTAVAAGYYVSVTGGDYTI